MSTSIAAARSARDLRPDWRDDAACWDADPELFFPDGDVRSARTQVKTAKLICRGCPVSATCLSWALASGQEAGIWGGLTEDERRRLHRRGPSFRPASYSLRERVGPGPADPGSTPGRRPAESRRTEQLPPATQVRVRGSQIEVDRVQP